VWTDLTENVWKLENQPNGLTVTGYCLLAAVIVIKSGLNQASIRPQSGLHQASIRPPSGLNQAQITPIAGQILSYLILTSEKLENGKSFQLQIWHPRETAYNSYWCWSTIISLISCTPSVHSVSWQLWCFDTNIDYMRFLEGVKFVIENFFPFSCFGRILALFHWKVTFSDYFWKFKWLLLLCGNYYKLTATSGAQHKLCYKWENKSFALKNNSFFAKLHFSASVLLFAVHFALRLALLPP